MSTASNNSNNSSNKSNKNASGGKVSLAAVVKCLGVNDDGNVSYSWRRCGEQGRWLSPAQQGDVFQLNRELTGSNREVCLLLPGSTVITAVQGFNPKERKHILRLLPYELEADTTSEVKDLHFAFGRIANDQANIAYVDNDFIAGQLQLLAANGIEVRHCLAEYLLLPYREHCWTLRWRNDGQAGCLDVRYQAQLGFSIDGSLAAAALAAFCQNNRAPEDLYLIAEDQEGLQQLRSLLPATLTTAVIEEHIETQLLDQWDGLHLADADFVDLRQGKFARRLPVKRWVKEWRAVAAMALVAILAYVAVNVGQIQYLESARADLETQKIDVARQVIPQGYIQDASGQIEKKLATYRNTAATSQSMRLLSLVTPVASATEDIAILELRYTQARGDLSLGLEADSVSAIESFRSKLAENKLSVDPSKTTARGDKYRAQIVVRLAGS